jgi:hypothetical protein
MLMTTLHLGQMPGRARHSAARSGRSLATWRSSVVTPAFGGLRATSVDCTRNRYEGIAVPAGDTGFGTTPTTKRSARHLVERVT